MKKSSLKLLAIAWLSLVIASGCGLLSRTPVGPSADDLATFTVQTVEAELTRIASLATATETALPPTAEPPTPDLAGTQAQETAMAEQTQLAQATATPAFETATSTPTSILPTATQSPSPTAPATARPGATVTTTGGSTAGNCDRAELVSEVTVLPGSSFTPGATFTKTWRLRNTGTCTWTRDYDLVFVSGDALGGPAAVALKADVKPNESVDLSVDLKAPSKTGDYQGTWRLSNATGTRFGVGSRGDQSLVVKIKVSALTTLVYDLGAKYCDAAWRNEDNSLPCPGVDGDAEGYVLRVDNPTLENGNTENEPALIVHPRAVTDGVVRGRFPEFGVQAGDHFKAVIGCLDGNTDCAVRFLFRYRIGGGNVITLQEWSEKFDGKVTKVDIDLTSLAGQKVQFILTVRANGEPSGDRVFWLNPRIVR